MVVGTLQVEVSVTVLVAVTVCVTSLVWVEWMVEGRGVSVTLMVDEVVTVLVVVEVLVTVEVLDTRVAATLKEWRKMTSTEIAGIANHVTMQMSPFSE